MTPVPSGLRAMLADVFPTQPTRFQYIGGGSINLAARVEAGAEQYFVKWKTDAPPHFFEIEARGLDILREAGEIRVPEVVRYSEAGGEHPAFLILEWIDESQRPEALSFAVNFGRALAQLHRHSNASFGLDHDNYIGELPQSNRKASHWPVFFRDQRLAPQINLAKARGRLPAERERWLHKVIERIEQLLTGCANAPSLLHGDLWSGNFLVTDGNQPVVVDPAVYYGDREVEIAFTELFGGFPPGFLPAYREAYPLERGYERRKLVYQLYPLLVHLNLFGESYGVRVDSVCRSLLA